MNRPIILASKSPRRKELLTALGFKFVIKTKDVNEDFPDDMPVTEVAAYLAQKKARACADFITSNEILLTADSVVIINNKIYNKPADTEEAYQMIKKLSGNVHQVITGVCLLSKDKEVVFSETAQVYMKALTDEEIYQYIEQFKPFDKAGSYGIQDWIGMAKIYKIEGTYTNIMGLPTAMVYEELMKF